MQRIASFQEFRTTRQQGGRGGPCVQYGLRRIGWGWCISILRSKEKHHGFDITDKAITEAVKEVNATGDAFVGPLVRSDNCCDRDSRASRPGVFE